MSYSLLYLISGFIACIVMVIVGCICLHKENKGISISTKDASLLLAAMLMVFIPLVNIILAFYLLYKVLRK